ncbi:prepilin peptidase [Actinoplanes sp. NPDC051851]|uniref:prepilin peptidase n=1 Tax=Actinoplanes sp. NPDC051851 TaxID=3154753 RepID=UPI00342EA471
MSSSLVIMSAVFGAAAGLVLPRLADRWAPARRARRGVTVVCSAVAAGVLGTVPERLVLLPAVPVGVLLAVVDLRCLRLPDALVTVLTISAGLPLAAQHPARVIPALLAAAAVGAGYLTVALLPAHGLGLGDVKLGAALALLTGLAGGWPAVLVSLAVAHLIGGVLAVGLLIGGRPGAFPFGPALLAGSLAGLLRDS